MDSSVALDAEARRLLWRCRRGMKELDVLLERFAKERLPTASPEERRMFERLLQLPDPVLVDYLLGQVIPADAELAQLLECVAASVPRADAQSPLQSAFQPPNPATGEFLTYGSRPFRKA